MASKDDKSLKDEKKKRRKETGALSRADRYDFSYTQNRELSWLRFDDRVLSEAYDQTVPLFERLKFAAIFQSNLDEFFMIRVGGLSDLATLKRQPVDNKSNMTPSEQIDAVFSTLPPLIERQNAVVASIERELERAGVRRLSADELAGSDRTFVERYFQSYVSPVISPLVIDPRHPFPNLRNGALYIVCALASEDEDNLMGLIEVPTSMNRVVAIAQDENTYRYILLEDVILACLGNCFGLYEPLDRAVVRVTRNADIDPDGEGVEEDEDYRQHMKKILKKRLRLQPVALQVQGTLETATLKAIRKALGLLPRSVLRYTTPLDLDFVYGIESHLPESTRTGLVFSPFRPQANPSIDATRPMKEQIIEGDKLLFYPYESMNPLLDLMHQAAFDDACISMKITLYRVAKQSRLCESLIDAAENGKEVTVLMELRARFDEQNNIEWAERLEEAGCTVIYGAEGFKVHSKICQITYREGMALTRITLLGTGNFNEKTAKLYSDFMLMTAHPGIGEDANAFFRNLALGNLAGDYRYLGVAPAGLKPLIMNGLNREIERAHAGEPARVFFKMNSLTDREVMDKIAEASQAGVDVQMIIRGISCLVPGIPGKTENVHIRSIVGRFLEHARVYSFGVDADIVYLSSADMMTRNTEHRVEIAYPVLDPGCRNLVQTYMQAQLDDNVKARQLTDKGEWAPVERSAGEADFNSQEYLLNRAYELAAHPKRAAAQRAAAAAEAASKAAASAAAEAEAEAAAKAAFAAALAETETRAQATQAPAPEPAATPTGSDSIGQASSTPAAGAAPAKDAANSSRTSAPSGQAASASAEPAPAGRAATAPAMPAAEIPVRAQVIDESAPASGTAPTDSGGAKQRALAKRPVGRVRTGLALIGLGLKTLITGKAGSSR